MDDNAPILRWFLLVVIAFGLVAAPAHAQRTDARVKVKLVKPLVLTSQQDLDFGTLILSGGAGTSAVTIRPDGTLDCPTPILCTGAAVPGLFNIKGTNRLSVLITASASDLSNRVTGDTIAFAPIAPTRLMLPNSGNQGTDFAVGGTLTVPGTAAGEYEGIIEITAEYE